MMEIQAIMQGLSFSTRSLHEQIKAAGWSVKKLKYDKKTDRYLATGKSPHGEEVEKWGRTEKLALSALLVAVSHQNHMRSSKLSMWTHTFTDQLSAIAEAYSKAPIYEPKAAAAFLELGRDSVRRAEALGHHLEIIVVHDPEPYTKPEKMFDDIRKRRKLIVSRAGIEHPIWSEEEHLAYRIVHDVLGHAASGGGFDWEGENLAFAAHASIIDAESQKALFTESIGHTAYAAYYRAYGPKKIVLFPKFLDKVQEQHNLHKHHPGTHPSQSFPPVELPHIKPLAGKTASVKESYKLTPEQAQTPLGGLVDPNDGWQSGVQPLEPTQLPDGRTVGNALLHHGDPLGLTGPNTPDGNPGSPLKDNAQLIEREWAYLNQEDPAQLQTMKTAIINAFRNVLLSPKKELKWNAAHYQDISHIPGEEDNPHVYYQAIENARQEYNVGHGYDRYSHLPYAKEAKKLTSLLYSRDPQGTYEQDGRTYRGFEAAQKHADAIIFQMRTRIEEKLTAEDAALPEEKARDHLKIELEANKEMAQWLKVYMAGNQPGMDHVAAPQMTMDTQDAQAPKPEVQDKYGALMYGQLRDCAIISQHADEILKAALYDVHERNGEGWHFRSVVLHLNIPKVGPKVCSFAWLLLSPMTSELATIDTHMVAIMGGKRGTAPTPRDYFKTERQFRARMDAAGYNGVPLGMLQWGAWDAARTGIGSHQDHSPLAVSQPANWRDIDWHAHRMDQGGASLNVLDPNTDWWKATEPAGEAAGEDFDQTTGHKVPQDRIPYRNLTPDGATPGSTFAKTATSRLTPWYTHPETGERVHGQPGQTLMQHATSTLGMSVPEVWQKLEEAGKTPPVFASKRADLYHVAPTVDRGRIKQHGLQPSNPYHNWSTPEAWAKFHGEDFRPPDGVYGFPEVGKGYSYAEQLDRLRETPHDVWRIPDTEIQEAQVDPDLSRARYVPHPVMNPQLHEGPEDRPNEWTQWGYRGELPPEKSPGKGEWGYLRPKKIKELGIGLPDRVIGKTKSEP